MITTSIVPDKLKDFNYYINKLPNYLQNSFGFIEHFRIWYDILVKDVINNADIFLNLLLLFDKDYLTYLQSIDEEMSPDDITCDILDKLGNLFGVSRYITVEYEEAGVKKKESLILNNNDFLILIKAQIIRNYCEGTREQINEYYKSVGLEMYVQTDALEKATANMYLTTGSSSSSYNYSENIKKLFLAGQLRIESMGIKYTESFLNIDRLLFWDTINEAGTTGWDGGQWII